MSTSSGEISSIPTPAPDAAPPTRRQRVAGAALTGLAVLFLAVDTTVKVLNLAPALEATTELGYPASSVRWIGLIQLACLALYVAPRTSVLGAVLLTGYLGGAVATHVRVGNPLFSHTLFPIYVGILVWAGLYLREQRLGTLLPLRRTGTGARFGGSN